MKQSTKAFIGALALTGLGFSLGVATDRFWLSGSVPAESQEEVRGRLLADLQATVGLSEEQLTSVHMIFSRYQVVISAAWEDMQPQLESALDSVFAQINDVLDPDQVEMFHHWFQRTHPIRRTVSP